MLSAGSGENSGVLESGLEDIDGTTWLAGRSLPQAVSARIKINPRNQEYFKLVLFPFGFFGR